jgi:hypothetical protein
MGRQFSISNRGAELARQLVSAGAFDASLESQLAQAVSRIARLVPRYARIQEMWCNDEMRETRTKRLEAREAQIEATIARILATLPPSAHGPLSLVFQGDPRGYVVRIKVPGMPRAGNTWGLGGEFGI